MQGRTIDLAKFTAIAYPLQYIIFMNIFITVARLPRSVKDSTKEKQQLEDSNRNVSLHARVSCTSYSFYILF